VELGEDGGIKAGIVQGQSEQVLPVDAFPHFLCHLTIRKVFEKLEGGDQRKSLGGFCRLSARMRTNFGPKFFGSGVEQGPLHVHFCSTPEPINHLLSE